MAWVEALLTKAFIEEGGSDIEGFKALERSFSHQHRGQQSHSHFMRPLCQISPRAPRIPEQELKGVSTEEASQTTPVIVINGGPESNGAPRTPVRSSTSGDGDWFKSSPQHSGKDYGKGPQKDKGKKTHAKGSKSPKGTETPTKEYHKTSYHLDHKRGTSPGSPGRKDPIPIPLKGNIFTFMPYLHFESSQRRQEMQEAIQRAEILKSPLSPTLGRAKTYDEMLIRAHLTSSTASLHVRRTLDQSFYHNIDTASRDKDQVVYRYQLKGKDVEEDNVDPKIVMVDQLWMWILGKDLIVTSFPQRWQQPKNDPLNVLDSVIEDINSKTRDPVKSVYDLSMVITSRCTGVFDRHRMGDEEYQFLDMFESSIGSATDRETVLFKEFNAASAQASAWLQQNRRPNRFSRYMEYNSMDRNEKEEAKIKNRELREENFKFEEFMRGPLFVDKLLDIGQETDLLAETKDIRDELNMMEKVLEDQRHVLPDLEAAVCDIYKDEQRSQQEVKKRFREQLKTIEMHIKDIERMDRQAERIYDSITDMLDLKQKHANAFEARFARDQAAGTARQTQTIILFTIVTIVFLPLSFIAAFFAIDIREFPHSAGNPSLPLGYVSKYTFGIGFAISIPLIAIALNLGDIGDFIREIRRRINQRARQRREKAELGDAAEDGAAMGTLRIEQAISIARSARKSVDTDWIRERLSTSARPGTAGTGGRREKITGFRMRASNDIERGIDLHNARSR
jgi:Mg2+ and Co2+ transporter CorA